MLLRNATEQAAWAPADGALARRIDTGQVIQRNGGSWDLPAPPAFYAQFRRSDGALTLNNAAATSMKWQAIPTDTIGTTTGSDGNGAFVTLPPGVYDVTVLLPVNLGGWTRVDIGVSGGASILLGGAGEAQTSAFGLVAATALVHVAGSSSKIWVTGNSNPGGAMRADGDLRIVRRPNLR